MKTHEGNPDRENPQGDKIIFRREGIATASRNKDPEPESSSGREESENMNLKDN